MKRNLTYQQRLLTTLLCFCLIGLVSCTKEDDNVTPQSKSALLSRDWQVESATSAYGRVTYLFYKKGNTENDADLSGYRFSFRTDNTYNITDGAQSYSGTWELTQDDTLLEMDGQDGFSIGALTDTNLDLSFTTDETDENGNTISVTTTYHLIPAV